MELNEKCIAELSDLKEMISKSHDYENLINYYIEIINRNHILDDIVKSEIVLKSRSSAKVKTSLNSDIDYTIYGGVSGIEAHAKRLAANFYKDFSNVDKLEIDLLFIMTILLHETAHLYQLSLARKCNDLLGRVYNLAFSKVESSLIYSCIVYKIMKYKMFYERSANVIAFRENRKIYEDTELKNLITFLYNSNLFSGYELKDNSYVSPMEKTFKYLRINENIDTSNISPEEIITHGLPIYSTKKFNELCYSLTLKNLSEINYNEVRKKH